MTLVGEQYNISLLIIIISEKSYDTNDNIQWLWPVNFWITHLSAVVIGKGGDGTASLSIPDEMPEDGADAFEGAVVSRNSSGSSGHPKASLVFTYSLMESTIVTPAGSPLAPTSGNVEHHQNYAQHGADSFADITA